jgi:hypothetical protein
MNIALAVVALVMGLVGFQYLVPREESFGLFSAADGNVGVQYALTFGATILGVIIGSFYRGLRAVKDAKIMQVPPGFVINRFRSVDMWLGLVASPIVYALLLKASDGMSLPGLIILALENGFCALIIIDSVTNQHGGANEGAGTAANETMGGETPP